MSDGAALRAHKKWPLGEQNDKLKSINYPNKTVNTQLHKTIAFNQHSFIVILAISDKVYRVCAVSGITNPISIYTELLINVYLFPINNFRVYPN